MSVAVIDLRSAIRVDFLPVNEKWETFKLSDGSRIKGRIFVTGVLRTMARDPSSGEPVYTFGSQNLFVAASVPSNLYGTPSPQPITQENLQSSISEVVDFASTAREDVWSVYNLSDGSVLRLKLIVNRIARSTLFDATGEPFYHVVSGNTFRIRISPKLIEKPRTAQSTETKGSPYG